jgi:hypothetical protein
MTSTLSQNVMALTKNEQAALFQMLTDHVELLAKVLPDQTLINFIQSGNFADSRDPVAQAYMTWKNQK